MPPARPSDDQPPAFRPETGRRRPDASDARTVGDGAPVSPSRPPAPRRTTGTPARPAARPVPTGERRPGTLPPPAPNPRARSAQPAAGSDPGPATRVGPPAGLQPSARSATGRATGRAPGAPVRPQGRPAPARPGPPAGPPPAGGAPGVRDPRRRRRLARTVVVLLLVALLAWPVGLLVWANGKIQRTDALSGASGTAGTTYLLAGSDARGDGGVAEDGTTGQRTDTILVLHVPASGPTALISLPRDTYVEVPGNGPAKLNAAYAWGGAPLLVQTVEGLTGLTVDHYAEIGMGGVEQIVDAVDGVNLCYDADVNDPDSGMVWTAGCHDVDGTQALAFARMRKSDPQGDVGRALRQRQLIGAVMGKVSPGALAVRPGQQVSLVDAGTAALTTDEDASIVDLGRLALAFKAANGADGITGTPPISSMDYRPGDIGSTVLLDPDLTPAFFADIRDGALPAGEVGGIPGS